MQRGDGPSFDAGDEEGVGVFVGILNEVVRRLIGSCANRESVTIDKDEREALTNSHKRNSLVGGTEPDDLRSLMIRVVSSRIDSFSFPSVLILLLLSRGARRSKDAQ